ncbi:MAG: C-terminal helicase domain-containing protein, partial [Bacteroidota bacterium]
PLVVIDTQRRTVCATRDGGYSRFNERTARLCVDLAIEAVRDGVGSIAIIAPYVEQSRLIRGLLAGYRAEAERIECRTVHRFQGGERDMVILDMVDAAPLSPGVLLAGSSPRSSSRNLLNVSISRARGKLVIISDVDYFKTQAPNGVVNEILRRGIRDGMRVEME